MQKSESRAAHTLKGLDMDFRNQDWIELVKGTRKKFGCSLEEAHDKIFEVEEMRRIISWRINHDLQCRKMAMNNMRYFGEKSYFIRDGDRIRFR
jgi:hypothetical protein